MAKKPKQDQGLNHNGENLLRIMIASYFLAVSLGLIDGTDGGVVMRVVLPEPIASALAGGFMFITANLVLMGLMLRVAALLLALLVFWSSYIVNFGPTGPMQLDDFWRDLALIGGLMLTYTQPSSRTVEKRAMIRWKPAVRRLKAKARIIPKRVNAVGARTGAATYPQNTPGTALTVEDTKATLNNIFLDDIKPFKPG